MYVRDTIKAIPISVLNAGLVGPAFLAINPAGLEFPCFMIRIINDSNITVGISYDGNVQNDLVIDGDTFTFYGQPNGEPNGKHSLFQKGLVVWANAAAPGMGNIALVGYYHPAGS